MSFTLSESPKTCFVTPRPIFLQTLEEEISMINMRGSRNFRQGGGPGQTHQKSSDNVFFVFFFVLSLFYRSQIVNFKENYHFSRFQRGSNFFLGGGVVGWVGPIANSL